MLGSAEASKNQALCGRPETGGLFSENNAEWRSVHVNVSVAKFACAAGHDQQGGCRWQRIRRLREGFCHDGQEDEGHGGGTHRSLQKCPHVRMGEKFIMNFQVASGMAARGRFLLLFRHVAHSVHLR